ncbi:hypothetical protein MMUR_35870 [Mycolicibacterium murale]|uniref:Uncharacterized protein n=1 Tax=Mycolicibacterium murale TaxID=182220 RepID=A0A7I9WNX8_9MYCO|nr:hypothetical protein MMUR_35870 [Mycolicibacterium murale]
MARPEFTNLFTDMNVVDAMWRMVATSLGAREAGPSRRSAKGVRPEVREVCFSRCHNTDAG